MADSCFKANDDRGEKLLAEKMKSPTVGFDARPAKREAVIWSQQKKQKDKEKIEQKRKRDDIERR